MLMNAPMTPALMSVSSKIPQSLWKSKDYVTESFWQDLYRWERSWRLLWKYPWPQKKNKHHYYLFEKFNEDHKHIITVWKSGNKISRITKFEAYLLLKSIRPNVSDFFYITANHYLYCWGVTVNHFQIFLNILFDNIELAAAEEMDKAHAAILYKRHG